MNQYWSPRELVLVTDLTSTALFFFLLCSALCALVSRTFEDLLKGPLKVGKASPYSRSEGREI